MATYWRAIVRVSLNDDYGSALRNSIADVLIDKGFTNTKTGTWELETDNYISLLKAIRSATRKIENPPRDGVVLDHLWVYVDRRRGHAPHKGDAPLG